MATFYKVLFFLGLVCSISGSQSDRKDAFHIPEKFIKLGSALTAKAASLMILQRLKMGNLDRLEQTSIVAPRQESAINISLPLPALPDPLNLIPLDIPLQISVPLIGLFMDGFYTACSPHIQGLSKMADVPLNVSFDLSSGATIVAMTALIPGSLSIDSEYKTNVYFNLTVGEDAEETTFSGNGLMSVGLTDFYFGFLAQGAIPIMSGDRISLDKLEFDFGFEDVVLVAENFEINGTPYDLNELSELVKLLYDLVWGGGKEAIIESTRCLIDHVVNDCPILDLIGGVYDCLKLTFNNTGCFDVFEENESDRKHLALAVESFNLMNNIKQANCDPNQGSTSTTTTASPTTTGETTTGSPTTPTTTPADGGGVGLKSSIVYGLIMSTILFTLL